MGFAGDMHLVTIGRGLLELRKLSTNMPAKAMVESAEFYNVGAKPIGTEQVVTLVIHSEDGSGQDIYITCSPTQRFPLRNGDECLAKDLKGKRLISIGQNHVFCTEVRSSMEYKLLYRVYKLERTWRDYVYINGIKTFI